MTRPKTVRHARPAPPAVEPLEARRLLARAVPYVLEFDAAADGLADADGQRTGFEVVQPNSTFDEYQPALIDLDPAAGVLRLTSRGDAANGGNYKGDNTLANGLQTVFDASDGPFTVSTTLRGPLGAFDRPNEQAGLLYGPTQDNYLKVVLVARNDGTFVQFLDEQNLGGGVFHANGPDGLLVPVNAAQINSLELQLSGDPRTGAFTASFRVNGGATQRVPGELRLTGVQRESFFRAKSRAGLVVMHKNDAGPITAAFERFEIVGDAVPSGRPGVTAVRPGAGATDVLRDTFVAVDLSLPNGGVDAKSLTDQTVFLTRASDGLRVEARVNTTGGADAIVLTPNGILDPLTAYTFSVTDGVRDLSGAAFESFEATFTTGQRAAPTDLSIGFEKVSLESVTGGRDWSGVEFGPDGKLYASTLDGYLYRWTPYADGTIGRREIIRSLIRQEDGFTLITGFAFDPRSTPDSPIVWVSHSEAGIENATAWSSKISRLSGPNLETSQLMVNGLPRSVGDHLINQPNFGPDGLLYIGHGGNSAFGAPDEVWGFREERLLSGAIYTVDTQLVEQLVVANNDIPVFARTSGVPSPYDPFAPGAPIKLFATGIRNSFDLLWHSNGNLYAPINGSAAGGNTPASPDGTVPGITNVFETQPDVLLNVAPGGYYGHPNPTRGEYVHSGGNPTSGPDAYQLSQYPVGTQPDPNFIPPAYNFGFNVSPDGIIEYDGAGAFGGRLDGRIMVVRYSGGDDILVMKPNKSGGIASVLSNIPGLTGFQDPVDLIEDPATGNLYVAELAGQQLTLLRPTTPGGNIGVPRVAYFNEPKGGAAENQTLIPITNYGPEPLVLPIDALSIFNAGQPLFALSGQNLPLVIRAGETYELPVTFNPPAGAETRIYEATLQIRSSDPDDPVKEIRLRGLPTEGSGGSGEPSLQRIFEVFDLGIRSGDADPTTATFNPGAASDEIEGVVRFRRAGRGPVEMTPLAVFGPEVERPARIGVYAPGSPGTEQLLASVRAGGDQTVSPANDGPEATDLPELFFGPNVTTGEFGLVGAFSSFVDDGRARRVYSEPALNLWEPDANGRDKMKVYPLIGSAGEVVPNQYIVTFEEAVASIPSDFQDSVFVLRNVEPIVGGPEVGLSSLDGSEFANRVVFSRIGDGGLNPDVPNRFKRDASVRINNTGSEPLDVSLAAPTGPFSLRSASDLTIAPGGFSDVQLRFDATDGRQHSGELRLTTNDDDEQLVRVQLGGFFQSFSEQTPQGVNVEPGLQEVLSTSGITTQVAYGGQDLDTGGLLQARGEEVLSAYWRRADPDVPVQVQQIAAYHMQGNTNSIRWFRPDDQSSEFIAGHDGRWAQSLMPPGNDGGRLTEGSFTPDTAVFGFRVENEWSDNRLNTQEQPGGNYGHHMRFYQLRDREGRPVPDTYVMAMDFSGINYDYNDNVYVIRNIRPASGRPAAAFAGGYAAGSGRVRLDWSAIPDSDDYLVYRANSFTGKYTRLNDLGYTQTFFDDTTAEAGKTYTYAVYGLSSAGFSRPTYIYVRT